MGLKVKDVLSSHPCRRIVGLESYDGSLEVYMCMNLLLILHRTITKTKLYIYEGKMVTSRQWDTGDEEAENEVADFLDVVLRERPRLLKYYEEVCKW